MSYHSGKCRSTHLSMTKFILLFSICLSQALLSMIFAQNLRIDQPVRFLALGDSYTIGQSVAVQDRWPQQLYDSLAARGYQMDSLEIIAQTGWRTDNLTGAMAAAQLDSNYTLVSLLIGVNNQYQGGSAAGYELPFELLLQAAIGLAGGDKERVFVLSIPDYGYTPFGQNNTAQISMGINSFNAVNKQIAQQYGVPYFDITPISRQGLTDPSLVASDGLHPSGKMYREWVRLILASLPGNQTGLSAELEEANIYFAQDTQFPQLVIKSRQAVLLKVWNLSGQLVIKRENITSEVIPWTLPKGIYVYEVRNQQGRVKRGKLIY